MVKYKLRQVVYNHTYTVYDILPSFDYFVKLFNDIKDVIISGIKEDVDYKSYSELDYFD